MFINILVAFYCKKMVKLRRISILYFYFNNIDINKIQMKIALKIKLDFDTFLKNGNVF